MSWSIGYDENWKRDIGYGVPAYCDYPGCKAEIDRGLSYVCGGEPYGGDRGCGLFFCSKHLHAHVRLPQLCERCAPRIRTPFIPKLDHPRWMLHKLTDLSWKSWREKNPEEVKALHVYDHIILKNQLQDMIKFYGWDRQKVSDISFAYQLGALHFRNLYKGVI